MDSICNRPFEVVAPFPVASQTFEKLVGFHEGKRNNKVAVEHCLVSLKIRLLLILFPEHYVLKVRIMKIVKGEIKERLIWLMLQAAWYAGYMSRQQGLLPTHSDCKRERSRLRDLITYGVEK